MQMLQELKWAHIKKNLQARFLHARWVFKKAAKRAGENARIFPQEGFKDSHSHHQIKTGVQGFLFALDEAYHLALTAEVCFFEQVASGRFQPAPGFSGPSVFRMQVMGDRLWVDGIHQQVSLRLVSNEILTLAGKRYVVKILPQGVHEKLVHHGFLMSVLLFVWAQGVAIAGPALLLGNFSSKGSIISQEVVSPLGQSGDLKQLQVIGPNEELIPVKLAKRPVELWIFVDAASQCERQKVAKYLSANLSQIRQQFHPQSLISLYTYTEHGQQSIFENKQAQELPPIEMKCDVLAGSGSFANSLSNILKAKAPTGPVHVWIFTAGGMAFGAHQLEVFSQYALILDMFLYLPHLFQQVQTQTTFLNRSLKAAHLHAVNTDDLAQGVLAYFTADFEAPIGYAGTAQRFGFKAKPDLEAVFAELQVPPVMEYGFFKRASGRFHQFQSQYGVIVVLVLKILSGFLCVIGFFGFYLLRVRTPLCKNCMQPQSVLWKFCPFCNPGGLILELTPEKEDKKGLPGYPQLRSLAHLKGFMEFGQHKQSFINLDDADVGKNAQGKPWFFIEFRSFSSSTLKDQESLKIAILRRVHPSLDITVNGMSLVNERFLGSCDTIRVAGFRITFVVNEQGVKYGV
jgi:hypothetical protein